MMVSSRGQRGFSLLEMMVAVAILGIALGVMYQAVSGATRNVRSDERYAYAVELARSLVADNARVPAEGTRLVGETAGGFSWELEAWPIDMPPGSLPVGVLQSLRVAVNWSDGRASRQVVLDTVVEGVRAGDEG